MLSFCYKRAFSVLMKKPLRLWGLSLMSLLVSILAILFGATILPVAIAFIYIISVGMSKVYIDGINEREVNSDQLFEGFSRPFRIAGGMAWSSLWIVIWIIVPLLAGALLMFVWNTLFSRLLIDFGAYSAISAFQIIGTFLGAVVSLAGLVVATIKFYEYRFVPYILATRPAVTATQALRLSKDLTKGKKRWMFLADLIPTVALAIATLILNLLARIPVIGAIFIVLSIVLSAAFVLFLPIFKGLYDAAFYEFGNEAPARENTEAQS